MGPAKVHEWNEASKGMSLPESVNSAVARLTAMKRKGGKPAARAQKKAMSKSKRAPVRRPVGAY